MNKAEIIRKISKKAGVPDNEGKKFFEIFLKNASEKLKPGQSLKIDGIGLFQLRVGQIENSTRQESGEKFIYSDLIVFIDDENEGEEIIFNVPSGLEEEYHPADSYFSLSIGKPVIPLKGVKESEFFIPPSGTELRSLIESKIERLIGESEKTEGGKETETIHLKSAEDEGEGAFDWKKLGVGNSPAEPELPTRSDFMKTREFENLSWDFGENLSQEFEEEDAPGDENEPAAERTDKNTLHKFEINADEPEETVPLFEEENEDLPDENIFEEVIDEDDDEKPIYEEDVIEPARETEDSSPEEIEDLQEEIPEETNEPEITEEEIINELPEEETPVQPGREESVPKNFQRVTSLTKEFTTSHFDESEETEEEKPRRITEVRGGYQKVRRTTAEFDFDLSGIEGLDEIDEPPVKEKKSRHREYHGYREKSNLPSYIIALVVIIALAGIIFLYFKLKNANNEAVGNQPGEPGKQTKVIERDYDVPVTYPYEKPDKKYSQGTKAGGEESKTGDKTPVNTGSPVNNAEQDLTEVREPVNAERIGNYIYQYPEGIVVQTSSWKSKTIALDQGKKYRDTGYTAFVEKSDIPGMGLYYRVRVGYFKSLSEAENFVNGK